MIFFGASLVRQGKAKVDVGLPISTGGIDYVLIDEW
jgi:hypothetical protein